MENNNEIINEREIEPFKKINRKWKIMIIRDVCLAITLLVVIYFGGLFIYSQFHPDEGFFSFKAMSYEKQTKEIIKDFAEGDMSVLLGTGVGTNELRGNVVSTLGEKYNELIKGKKYTVEDLSYFYDEGSIYENVCSASIKFDDNTAIRFCISYSNLNAYVVELTNNLDENTGEEIEDDTYIELYKYVDFYNEESRGMKSTDLWKKIISAISDGKGSSILENWLTDDCLNVSNNDNYKVECVSRLKEVIELLKSCDGYMSRGIYDGELEVYPCRFTFDMTDKNGKGAIYEADFHYGPFGFEYVESTQKIISEDGFDEEVLGKMKKVF